VIVQWGTIGGKNQSVGRRGGWGRAAHICGVSLTGVNTKGGGQRRDNSVRGKGKKKGRKLR